MRILCYLAILMLICSFHSVALAEYLSSDTAGKSAQHHSTAKKKSTRKRIASRHQSIQPIYGVYQLRSELNTIIDSGLDNADVGLYVKSMKNGDTIFERNAFQPFTPASTMKVLTAQAALLYLGSDYRFKTQLLTDAKSAVNGVLQGNLYIVLSGDPTLTYEDLTELMATLKQHDIEGIKGNVFIDNTAYDQTFYGPGWEWDDKSYCYAAPISASIINHNCLTFKVAPSKVAGHPATVVKSSKYFYPRIRNSVVTKSKQSRACSLKLSTNTNSTIDLDGCMKKGGYEWGVSYVVVDIPEYNRALFKALLKRMDVDVYGTVTFGSATKDLSLVGKHESEPLRDLVREMLKKSDNIIAGALFKKLGQLYTGKPGSWENGSRAVANILEKKVGLQKSGLRLLDGSGLSPDNLATPSQLMQVLEYAYRHNSTSVDFVTSLPISGVDGTLKHRLANIARKVRAKTGTISGVASLAGYVMTVDKEPLAFVIMINGAKAYGWQYRAVEDRIATALARYKRNS